MDISSKFYEISYAILCVYFKTENIGSKPCSAPKNANLDNEDQTPERSQRPMAVDGVEPHHVTSAFPDLHRAVTAAAASANCTAANTWAVPGHSEESSSVNETSRSSFPTPPQPTMADTAARPPVTTMTDPSNPLPTLSPMAKSFPSAYERNGPYIPSFHFNAAYSDYVNHPYSSASLSQSPYSAVDPAPQQHYSFHHPISYNVAAAAAVTSSQSAPPPYWPNTNYAAPINGDLSYPHLSSAHKNFSPSYDIYKRDGFHQSYPESGLENRGLLARPTPGYDHGGRSPAMYYHSRQHDNFHCEFRLGGGGGGGSLSLSPLHSLSI